MPRKPTRKPVRKPASSPQGGRPTKLTPEVQERICALLRKGMPRERAARRAGIAPRTFHQWMSEGAKHGTGKFVQFLQAVHDAEDEWVEKAMGVVTDLLEHQDAKVRLASAKFGLTHRFREDFSTRQETTGAGGKPVQHEVAGQVEVKAEVAVEGGVTATPAFTAAQLAAMSLEQLQALGMGLRGNDNGKEG